jgi:hypothetical protein
MKFLNFECKDYFKTNSSYSFKLRERLPDGTSLGGVPMNKVYNVVGWLELHYPAQSHIKAFVRVFLDAERAKQIKTEELSEAVYTLFREMKIPERVTFVADLIPYDEIRGIENHVNEKGVSDGV